MTTTPHRKAFGLVEILVAAGILACALVPLLALVSSGRRTTEFNTRRLQALMLCQRVIDRVALEAVFAHAEPPAAPQPVPVMAADGGDGPSHYFRAFLGDRELRSPALAALAEQFGQNYRTAVQVAPDDASPHLFDVRVTVSFRLSPAAPTWHKVSLRTLVVRRSPF